MHAVASRETVIPIEKEGFAAYFFPKDPGSLDEGGYYIGFSGQEVATEHSSFLLAKNVKGKKNEPRSLSNSQSMYFLAYFLFCRVLQTACKYYQYFVPIF